MFGIRIMTCALLAVTLGAANSVAAGAAEVDAALRAELEHISQRRIFFGHQSVGGNLLDGIRQLSATAGVPIRIVETPLASAVPKATFGHALMAKNGDPLLKLRTFEHAVGQQSSDVDIALLKFCFVDINANTDAKALFAAYQSTIDRLRAHNKNTVFVHVTAPLTEAKSGLKMSLKRFIGRTPYEDIESLHREEYNALLRQTYGGREPIFDLARLESTSPDGTVITLKWDGNVAPVMVPEYTDDGGHLNAIGKLRAARELITILASIPDRAASAKIAH